MTADIRREHLTVFGHVADSALPPDGRAGQRLDRVAGMPNDRRIRFRIGINLGDVIVEDDDIFGDGVNIAARLEASSGPGGLCISRMVRDHIRDKLAYALEYLGEQNVKNVGRPVRVYTLHPEAVAPFARREGTARHANLPACRRAAPVDRGAALYQSQQPLRA